MLPMLVWVESRLTSLDFPSYFQNNRMAWVGKDLKDFVTPEMHEEPHIRTLFLKCPFYLTAVFSNSKT